MSRTPNFDLDTPLLTFRRGDEAAHFTIRQACTSVLVMGGTGSGKSSATGRILALKYLQAGFGGLVMTVKEDEAQVWKQYCREAGRLDDLIIIRPDNKQYFNFLEYECANARDNKSITQNLVETIQIVIKAAEDKGPSRGDDSFWENALTLLITNVIDLCLLAYGHLSVQLLYDIAIHAPRPETQDSKQSPDAFSKAFGLAKQKVNQQIQDWIVSRGGLTVEEEENPDLFEARITDHIDDARLIKSMDEFFSETYKNLYEKTRSIISFSFQNFLFKLLRDPIYSLFCRHSSNVFPEDCFRGKIVVLDIPVKIYQKFARQSQIMCKYLFQKAFEKRNVELDPLPVFIWADEAQFTIHEKDQEFQTTSRSSRIATVYLTQNLSNFYSALGGPTSEHRVNSFLGTMATKFFHANADVQTNKYASQLIGKGYRKDFTRGTQGGEKMSWSRSESYKLEDMVRPEEFVQLKTGGPENDFIAEAYIHVQGTPFPDGKNHKLLRFSQTFKL